MKYITLGEICKKGSSNIAQKDLEGNVGDYEIYGASGFIKKVDFYHQEKPYIAIVKDGAGVGRTMLLPAKSSVIGTMQYILPNDDIDIRYLYYAISNMNLGKYYMGAAIPHIYFKDYQSEQLPVRDIDEQKQIADVLAKTDALIADRQAQLSKFDELVKSRFVELFGTPLLNEKGWVVKSAGDVCSVTDGSHFSPVGKEDGYPMLSVRNMRNDGFHYDDCKLVSQEDYDILVKQGCKPLKNDVLIAKDGSYFYYGFVVKEEIEQAVLSSIAILRPNLEQVNPEYLCRYMLSSEIVDLVGKNYVTGAAIKRVILKGIKQIPVMLPPIELQNQFAAFVEQTDKSKLAIQKSLEKLETLKKALMQQYFG